MVTGNHKGCHASVGPYIHVTVIVHTKMYDVCPVKHAGSGKRNDGKDIHVPAQADHHVGAVHKALLCGPREGIYFFIEREPGMLQKVFNNLRGIAFGSGIQGRPDQLVLFMHVRTGADQKFEE